MIYSDTHKFVFIHNPKVAGTSMRNALSRYDTSDNFHWGPVYSKFLQRTIDKAHIQANELQAFPELQSRISKYFTFIMVREPVDRFQSSVKYYNKRKPDRAKSVEEFVVLFEQYPSLMRYDTDFIHFCPQHFFFILPNGKSIADRVLPIENFTPNALVDTLDVPLQLSRSNETEKSTLLNADLVERIRVLYAKDYSNIPAYSMENACSTRT